MSILSDARQLCKELQEYYRAKENGYHPECEPLIVSESARMLPEVLAYAERREMQAIEARGQIIQYHRGILYPLDRSIDFWNGMPKEEKKICCEQAAKELSADLSSWRKITEEEKAAIENTIAVLIDYGANCEIQIGDVAPLIEVLRGLIQ